MTANVPLAPLLERIRRRSAAVVHDLVMVGVAWLGAYWIRFNLEAIPGTFLHQALSSWPVVLLIQGGAFWYFGLYRGVWRFASLPDLIRIVRAVVVGTVLSMAVLYVLFSEPAIPRSVPALYLLLVLPLVGGPRLIYRSIKDYHFPERRGHRVLIVGAGRSGEMLARDMLRDPRREYQPVAFVDDDRSRWGREIQGIPVRGGCERISELVQGRGVDHIVIAIPSAARRDLRRIIEICEGTGLPVHILPRLHEMMSGHAMTEALREVSIEDLLGRDPVSLDWDAIRGGLRGRTILVTGAGGSIGSELCRQIASLGPERLILFERGEYNLYRIHQELQGRMPGVRVVPRLGDVTDARAVNALFAELRPQVVFHAAAYKHVPLLEAHVREAVVNNVLGTRVVANAAAAADCEEFVLISTDKAVNPANVMGATKRLAERICLELDARTATRFVVVRFGNVLGSAGSVVPLFQRQIEAGGPVTVTHPDMTRFFMTIPEACQLIMQAAVIGHGGEILVLDMGSPIRIDYLARQMIQLAGKIPGEDIEIVYTGLRPGEKLTEELCHEQEALIGTSHAKILMVRTRRPVVSDSRSDVDELAAACATGDAAEIVAILHRLLPEYRPQAGPVEGGARVIPLPRAEGGPRA